MTFSDSAASGAAKAQPSAQEAQKLIALLSNLMPLLQGLQSQAFEQCAPFASAGFVLENQNPVLDQQAAANLVEDMTADLLRTLSVYLDTYAEQYPALNNCVGLVTQAANCFAAHDYGQSFGLIWQAYRLITALRMSNPQVPSPRAVEQSAQRPTTQLH